MISITITGHVGRGGVRQVQTRSGAEMYAMSVCADVRFRNPDGSSGKRASWFDVSVFGAQGRACAQYVRQGTHVLVRGRFEATITQRDGKIFLNQRVTADNVEFLGQPQAQAQGGQAQFYDYDPADIGYEPPQAAPVQPAPQPAQDLSTMFAGMQAAAAPAPKPAQAPAPAPSQTPAAAEDDSPLLTLEQARLAANNAA